MSEKILSNPDTNCSDEILSQQVEVFVNYYDFNGNSQRGVIEVHGQVAKDVADFFQKAYEMKFPIEKVVRASDEPYEWNDNKLMAANTSSGFNYRTIAGTDTLSHHSRGLAFDVNTRINPYVRLENGKKVVAPFDAEPWNPRAPGALHTDHPLVKLMTDRGWMWGGNWTFEKNGMIDYQHFQKDLI